MKKFAVFIAAGLMSVMGLRATVAEADSAYIADDFLRAASLYQEAIDSLGPSVERYYNLGNAYYRAGLNGMAIVSYERALRLDPSNSDVKDNLEFVNSKITDRTAASGSLFSSAADKVAGALHPNVWAWIALSCFVLALIGVCVYFLTDAVILRKIGFFGGGLLLIFAIIGNVLAWRATRVAVGSDAAVVVSPSVILSTAPRQPKDRTEEAMLLHEGTKLQILDSIPGTGKDRMWYDVKVDNSHRAWVSSDAIEII
ncbi:MAG: tetratricopeptide repeat protein [Muribaculaceae bacterium]|nr:tetratricopeptide repeat protein [Muribaculaceae bacterium]